MGLGAARHGEHLAVQILGTALIRGALGGQPVGELEVGLWLQGHGRFLVGAVRQL
jgi:hypothetical protein